MPPVRAFVALLGALAVLVCTAAAVASTTGVLSYKCDLSEACFPWNSGGPSCTRKERMNLRFQLPVAPENVLKVGGIRKPIDNVTYAYCPRVDEVMSVNISNAGQLAVAYANGTNSSGGTVWHFSSTREQVYLKAIGFGSQKNVQYPQPGSQGRVLVADLVDAEACPAQGTVAIVPFLTLNVTMKKGKFEYFVDYPQPAGVGFWPSCDRNDRCQLDSKMLCIGEPTRKNCAQCYNAEQASRVNLQVWVSYFGTDSSGRHLRSGSQSPLNFVRFAGGSVGSSVTKAFDDVQSGNVIPNSDLQPK